MTVCDKENASFPGVHQSMRYRVRGSATSKWLSRLNGTTPRGDTQLMGQQRGRPE
ncbi:hypothetical protein GCM10028799_29600 [Kribbella italica]